MDPDLKNTDDLELMKNKGKNVSKEEAKEKEKKAKEEKKIAKMAAEKKYGKGK